MIQTVPNSATWSICVIRFWNPTRQKGLASAVKKKSELTHVLNHFVLPAQPERILDESGASQIVLACLGSSRDESGGISRIHTAGRPTPQESLMLLFYILLYPARRLVGTAVRVVICFAIPPSPPRTIKPHQNETCTFPPYS